VLEEKKSKNADLESRRPLFFLLGLILGVALLFVALEFNSSELGDGDVEDLEALIDKEDKEDMIPYFKREDIQLLPPPPQEIKPKKENAKINIVDDSRNASPDEIAPSKEADNMGDEMEPESDDIPDTKEEVKPLPNPENPLNFQIVEELPEYPGGMTAFMKWLTKNLRYPVDAQKKKIQGQVTVQFFILPDGTIADASVIKGLYPSCDREVLRVIRMMPKWKPGTQHKKPVKSKFVIPVVFKL